MINTKPASTDYPIMDVIANRWSPVIYSERKVEQETVESLLEAARWAPSSFNEQPWSYVVGYKGDENHQKIGETLADGNAWAKDAPVLMISVAKTFFDHKHNPNRHYMHDTGMATMNLVLQATEMDLVTHQMAGFDVDKTRELFNIPGDYEPGSVIVIGYAGDVDSAPDDMKERDSASRQRKNLGDLYWKIV